MRMRKTTVSGVFRESLILEMEYQTPAKAGQLITNTGCSVIAHYDLVLS
jgi:hypothetical protein